MILASVVRVSFSIVTSHSPTTLCSRPLPCQVRLRSGIHLSKLCTCWSWTVVELCDVHSSVVKFCRCLRPFHCPIRCSRCLDSFAPRGESVCLCSVGICCGDWSVADRVMNFGDGFSVALVCLVAFDSRCLYTLVLACCDTYSRLRGNSVVVSLAAFKTLYSVCFAVSFLVF